MISLFVVINCLLIRCFLPINGYEVIAGTQAAVADTFTLPAIGVGVDSPVALESWLGVAPVKGQLQRVQSQGGIDCSNTVTTLCNQGAWADFGLAASGLIPKQSLCAKYSPSSSCITLSLSHCNESMLDITRTMMIAFGRVIVSWCYDGGWRLSALEPYTTCLSVAMFDTMTIRQCLTHFNDPVAVGKASGSNNLVDPESDLPVLPKLINNFADTYQSSAIVCMHGAIAEACGREVADLALGPAMDELVSPTESPPSTTTTVSLFNETSIDELQALNDSEPIKKTDLFSRSREFMTISDGNGCALTNGFAVLVWLSVFVNISFRFLNRFYVY